MADQKSIVLRKRQQITKANHVMFLWVAGASVVLGASAVVLFVLVQNLIYNEKVLAEKQNTVNTLEHNNSIVGDLQDSVRTLNTSQPLIDLQTPADKEPIQVVFDALPSRPNSEALGSALGHRDILGDPSLSIEALSVDSVSGENEGDSSSSENTIGFSFTVSARDPKDLEELLDRMSLSIRSFNVTSVSVEKQGTLQMTVEGYAYYQPAKTVEVTEKEVPR